MSRMSTCASLQLGKLLQLVCSESCIWHIPHSLSIARARPSTRKTGCSCLSVTSYLLLRVSAPLPSSRLRRVNLTQNTGVAFVAYVCNGFCSSRPCAGASAPASLPALFQSLRVLSAPPADQHNVPSRPLAIHLFGGVVIMLRHSQAHAASKVTPSLPCPSHNNKSWALFHCKKENSQNDMQCMMRT